MPVPPPNEDFFRKVLDDFLEMSFEEYLQEIQERNSIELDEGRKILLKKGFVAGFLQGVRKVIDSIKGYRGVLESMQKETIDKTK